MLRRIALALLVVLVSWLPAFVVSAAPAHDLACGSAGLIINCNFGGGTYDSTGAAGVLPAPWDDVSRSGTTIGQQRASCEPYPVTTVDEAICYGASDKEGRSRVSRPLVLMLQTVAVTATGILCLDLSVTAPFSTTTDESSVVVYRTFFTETGAVETERLVGDGGLLGYGNFGVGYASYSGCGWDVNENDQLQIQVNCGGNPCYTELHAAYTGLVGPFASKRTVFALSDGANGVDYLGGMAEMAAALLCVTLGVWTGTRLMGGAR